MTDKQKVDILLEAILSMGEDCDADCGVISEMVEAVEKVTGKDWGTLHMEKAEKDDAS